jgi:hypothetical protein
MLISGIIAVVMLCGGMTAVILAFIVVAVIDKRHDLPRRHWRPAESSTH